MATSVATVDFPPYFPHLAQAVVLRTSFPAPELQTRHLMAERKAQLPATVFSVPPETSVLDAAHVMVAHDVGAAIVLWDRKPIGILTDRDLVTRVLASGWDPKNALVWEVMSKPMVTIEDTRDLNDALRLMAAHGIRRLPIVDAQGRMESLITLDDVLRMGLDGRSELGAIVEAQMRVGAERVAAAAEGASGLTRKDLAVIARALSVDQPVGTVAHVPTEAIGTIDADATVLDIAARMTARDLGDVVVVLDRKPLGIVTDRDLVVRVMARSADPATTRAWEVMSKPVVTVSAKDGVNAAVACMQRHGIRRLPIVDDTGEMLSLLTLDDILLLELNGRLDLREVVRRQGRPSGTDAQATGPAVAAAPPPAPVAPLPPPPPQAAPAPPLPPVERAAAVPPPIPATVGLEAAQEAVAVPQGARSGVEPAKASSLHEPPPTQPGRVTPPQSRAAHPVHMAARRTIVKPMTLYRRSRLDYAKDWLFWNKDWLSVLAWLIFLGVLLAFLAGLLGEGIHKALTIDVYEPKDQERLEYLKRLQEEREKAAPPP